MIERRIEVVGVDGDSVLIRADASCSGCTGCGGRCGVMRDLVRTRSLRVPSERFPHPPRVGEAWAARCDERALLGAALRGYGVALAGLLGGALLGHYMAVALDAPRDPAAAVAALLGILLALRSFRRRGRLPVQLHRSSVADA